MPDEIQNEEGVDFSRYYDGHAQQIQKEVTMARNAATQQASKVKRTKIVVFVSIFVILALVEIGLLWYGTLGSPSSAPKPNIPAGYTPAVSPNGMPHYKLQKK
jgi:hypothetical protein